MTRGLCPAAKPLPKAALTTRPCWKQKGPPWPLRGSKRRTSFAEEQLPVCFLGSLLTDYLQLEVLPKMGLGGRGGLVAARMMDPPPS